MDWNAGRIDFNCNVYIKVFHNEWIIFLDVVSLLAGYVIIDNLKLHQSHDND